MIPQAWRIIQKTGCIFGYNPFFMLTERHRYAATGLNTLLGEHFEPQVMHMPKML